MSEPVTTVPLAQPPHTIKKQWLEEVLDTFGQEAFAHAALKILGGSSSHRTAPTAVLTGSSR